MKRCNDVLAVSLILLTSVLFGSCMVGGGGNARFDQVRYPVSGNSLLHDQNGKVVDTEERSLRVGNLHAETRFYSLFYGLWEVSDDYEFGPTINEQVRNADGDAVVNLRFESGPCGWDYGTIWLGFLPFIPGCNHTRLTGEIVRVDR